MGRKVHSHFGYRSDLLTMFISAQVCLIVDVANYSPLLCTFDHQARFLTPFSTNVA